MSGFSPEWLALREPIDHAARSPVVAIALARTVDTRCRGRVRVLDLGCGAGSNLRATAPTLERDQLWTLVDHDPRLLSEARARLIAWAGRWHAAGDGIEFTHAGRRIQVHFRRADLAQGLPSELLDDVDLVTCSALLDLCSVSFIERLAADVAAQGAIFHTTLTYDGEQSWQPVHEADDAMTAAFHAHQRGDKGFGPACGPHAPAAAREAFARRSYEIVEGRSPWRLRRCDAKLIAELAAGFAGAAGETGAMDPARIAAWAAVERTSAIVGHGDTLAVPPA